MTTTHKHWQPGTLMAQAYRDIANEHNATVDALAAAQAEIADWKAGRYRAVVLGPEHAGVHHATLGPEPITDEVIERMAGAAMRARDRGVTWNAVIRAALAAVGGVGSVNADMWKTPLVVQSQWHNGTRIEIHARVKEPQFSIYSDSRSENCTVTPADASRMAQWLASYAAAHGCQLAAVGPQYCPADVAFNSRVPGLEKEAEMWREKFQKLEASWNDTHAGVYDKLSEARTKIDNQRMSLHELHVARERDAVKRADLEAKLSEARREIADLRDQIDDDNTNAAAVNDLLIKLQNVTAERDTLRERAAVPVKVRFDVTVEEACLFIFDHRTKRKEEMSRIMHYLAAHAVIDTPAGVPTADEFNAHFSRIDRGLFEHEVIELIYDFLSPWLRDPVGWELDVTSEEMYDKWNDFTCDEDRSFQAVLDLCRSRIRPVMECKECAGWKAHAAAIEDSSFDMIKRISVARAALEGE